MTEIVPERLVLGSFADSFDVRGVLERYGVTHVLNVASECDVAGDRRLGLVYQKHGMPDDDAREDIRDTLRRCHAFIDAARAEDERSVVLVHCLEGISRSVCVLASYAYLSCESFASFDEALTHIKKLRPAIDPYPPYVHQAREVCQDKRKNGCTIARTL